MTSDRRAVNPPSADCRSDQTIKGAPGRLPCRLGLLQQHSIVNESPEREDSSEREESKREQTWGSELYSAACYGFTLRKEGQTEHRGKLGDLQRGNKEEKCLHTSCGHVQECPLSCRSLIRRPPAAKDDTSQQDYKNSRRLDDFSVSIFTWNLFYLKAGSM